MTQTTSDWATEMKRSWQRDSEAERQRRKSLAGWAALLLLLFLAPMFLFRVWVLWLLWHWLAVGGLALPPLTYWQVAAGWFLLGAACRRVGDPAREKMPLVEDPLVSTVGWLFGIVLTDLFSLGIGYLLTLAL
jgi:hypothetical protein